MEKTISNIYSILASNYDLKFSDHGSVEYSKKELLNEINKFLEDEYGIKVFYNNRNVQMLYNDLSNAQEDIQEEVLNFIIKSYYWNDIIDTLKKANSIDKHTELEKFQEELYDIVKYFDGDDLVLELEKFKASLDSINCEYYIKDDGQLCGPPLDCLDWDRDDQYYRDLLRTKKNIENMIYSIKKEMVKQKQIDEDFQKEVDYYAD